MAIYTQYANGRSSLPFSLSNIVVSSGGSLTSAVAGTYYFCLQAENLCGLTEQSAIIGGVSVAAGQQISITIPSTARANGEDWHTFIISASTSSDPTTFKQIGTYRGYDSPGVPSTLPATITITRDAHLQLAPTVANPAALPSGSDLKEGMIRAVTSLSAYYYYNSTSTLTADGTTVLIASPGRWLIIGTPNTYIDDIYDVGGARQEIGDINPVSVKVPEYTANGSESNKVTFWISNETDSPITAGNRIGFIVEENEQNVTSSYAGLLKVIINGIVNTTTGVLRTVDSLSNPLVGVGTEYTFQPGKTNLIIPDDVAENEALSISLYLKFRPEQTNGKVLDNSYIKAYPFIFNEAGTYNPIGKTLGDLIYSEFDFGRVVPEAGLAVKCLKRSGIVDSYEFFGIGETTIGALAANTASQDIYINGDGAVFLGVDPLADKEALRAIVSSETGTTNPSAYSSNISVASGGTLTVTCNYPSTSGGVGTIRGDYPDIIAGASGTFNPEQVYVYVRRVSDSVIKRYSAVVVPGTNQVVNVTSWSAGTTVSSLPTAASDFGLFAPGTCTGVANSGSSDFTSGNYQVAFAFFHSGNTITKISHKESDGCIREAVQSLATIQSLGKYWADPVADLTALRALTSADVYPGQSRVVIARNKPYRWNPSSTETDDTTATSSIVKLATVTTGRFIVDDASKVLTGAGVPSNSLGEIGDLYLNSTNGDYYQKTGISTWTLVTNLKGAKGDTGDQGNPGKNAFTTTTANFTQPSSGSNVLVSVTDTSWVAQGQNLYILNGGYYEVITVNSSTQLTVKNLGVAGNASPTTSINSGALVTPGGATGLSGTNGTNGTNGINAFTTTSGSFTQPTVNSNVTINVGTTAWCTANLIIFIQNGGYYKIISVDSATTLTIQNIGATGNASSGASVAGSSFVVSAGIPGATGATGATGSPGTASSNTGLFIGEVSSDPSTATDEVAIYNKLNQIFIRYEANGTIVRPKLTGLESIYVPAGAIRPRLTNGCAAIATAEVSSTTPNIDHLAFDAATVEYAQFEIDMPKQWDLGTLYAQFVWTGLAAGSGDVVWGIQACSQADGESIGTSFGSFELVTDTFQNVNIRHVTGSTFLFTVGSFPEVGASICFQVFRDATNVNDTRSADANLLGVRIFYQTDKSNDN